MARAAGLNPNTVKKKKDRYREGVESDGVGTLFQSPLVTQPGVLFLPTGSLSALVYQHSVIPLALPCKLVIPSRGRRDSLMLSAQNAAGVEAIQGTPPPASIFF